MLIVDASAVGELLLGRLAGKAVAREIGRAQFDLHAPHLIDVEVLSALRRLVAAGDAPVARAAEAVADFLDLPIERHRHDVLAPRVWELRENFSSYDAAYVALAEAITDQGAALLTADGRLARAAAAHTDVHVILAKPSG
jgi:predicted nucleic acid-binding protein